MLAYKPKEDPFLIKIAKSGMFQFLMVVLLGVAVTTFVVRTDQPQQWIQKINRFASVSPNPSQQAKTEAGIAEDQAEFEAPPPQANTWAARAASPTETAAMGTADATAATTAGAAAPQGSVSATTNQNPLIPGIGKLRIQMVEIDHDYLDRLMTEKNGQISAINGDVKSFRSFPETTLDNAYIKILRTDTLEMNKDKKNSSLAVGNNAHGFRLNFQVADDMQGKAIRFYDAVFAKNHPNDYMQFQFEIFMRFDEKFIISGSNLISYFEVENDLANTAPFQIFKSADYRNQKTTFAIIIELQ